MMRRTCLAWLRVLVAIVGLGVVAGAQQPTFRSGAGVVRVDVSVQTDGRPVTNLTANDFDLYDESARRSITELSYGKLPIDVTVALDVSKSVTGKLLADLRSAVGNLQSRLKDGDRLKLIAFNARLRRVLDFAPRNADTKAAFESLTGSGGTSILDTVAVTLTSSAPADRRQLIIFFSDGFDTSSVADTAGLIALARHTTPTLAFVGPFGTGTRGLPGSVVAEVASGGTGSMYTGTPTLGRGMPLPGPSTEVRAVSGGFYAQLAAETGGVIVPLTGSSLGGTFGDILDDFRSSYVLYFSPDTTAKPGFHALEVKVRRAGRFDVRARRGYVKE